MTIERNCDIVLGYCDLEPLYSFKNFPVFMGCTDQPAGEDITHDMNICISRGTGMLQLNPVLPLDVVYQKEHDSGTTGAGWRDHHRSLATFIAKYNPSSVFEIGGAHGILNAEYCENHGYVMWRILESNPNPVPECRAELQKGFFNADTEIDSDVDMLVHSHCLEHFYQPTEFFDRAEKLKSGTMMCFSVPNLQAHLERCYTSVLNFEHTYFCTEDIIEYWLANSGFELVDKYYYRDDHSIFYAARKVDNIAHTPVTNMYNRNKGLFENYINYHKKLVADINAKTAQTDQPVFLFGAHVFNQFLLNFGLDSGKIVCLLDNNSRKHNKRLYGTALTVKSPAILNDYTKPLVILRSGVFNEEIKQGIYAFNPEVDFLE
jgi:hypothetical protein